MNFSWDRIEDVEPFTISAIYENKNKKYFKRYSNKKQTKISKSQANIEKPQLEVNDESVETRIE